MLFRVHDGYCCGALVRHFWNASVINAVSVRQRIAAATLSLGLHYFGRSVHGQLDLNEDGLVDLAVGSLGAAVLLWCVVIPSCPYLAFHCPLLHYLISSPLPSALCQMFLLYFLPQYQ